MHYGKGKNKVLISQATWMRAAVQQLPHLTGKPCFF